MNISLSLCCKITSNFFAELIAMSAFFQKNRGKVNVDGLKKLCSPLRSDEEPDIFLPTQEVAA